MLNLYKKHLGFTLVELMITMAIVGIVAAFAASSYKTQMEAGRRVDATAGLMDLYARMERFYAQNNTYATATISTGVPSTDVLTRPTTNEQTPACGANTAPTTEQHYCLSISAVTATSFTLTATPRAGSPQTDDLKCTSFTINSLGTKGYTGSAASINDCWRN